MSHDNRARARRRARAAAPRAVVLGALVADQPTPYVPSYQAPCHYCGRACWLSERTSAGTVAAADQLSATFGDGTPAVVTCRACIKIHHPDIEFYVTTEVIAESKEAGL